MEEVASVSEEITLGANASTAFLFPVWIARRRKIPPEHFFFTQGNVEREHLAQQIAGRITDDDMLDFLSEELDQPILYCPIASCNAKLATISGFDAHYMARHMATCSVCSKQFPSLRLLNLHVAENHDSFFKAKAARGYLMYECLVEGCSSKFHTDASRHRHLVDLHKFPRTFQFSRTKHLAQKQRKKLQQKRPPATAPVDSAMKGERSGLSRSKADGNTMPANSARKGSSARLKNPQSLVRNSDATEVTNSAILESVASRSESPVPMLPQGDCERMEVSTCNAQQCQGKENEAQRDMDVDIEALGTKLSKLSTLNSANLMVPAVISFGRRRAAGAVRGGRGR